MIKKENNYYQKNVMNDLVDEVWRIENPVGF
jgi:hypothetical protein